MNLDYTRDIPDGPHNPSADQGPMQTNTNSTDTILTVDHFSFNDNNGGLHQQVRMPIIGSGAKPSGQANEVLLYPKTIATHSELFLARDANAFETQMTVQRSGDGTTDIPTISGNDVITYLPGGLIMICTTTSTVVGSKTFPFGGFPNNCFNVQVSINGSTGGANSTIMVAAFSKTNYAFNSNISGSATITKFLVIAIGN
jgi:hypothetical protein